MKRLLLLVLMMLFLVACNDDANATKNNQENESNNSDEANEIEEYTIDESKKLGITIEDIIEIDSTQREFDQNLDVSTYEYDEFIIDNIDKNGNLSIFTYRYKNDDYPFVILARTNAVEEVTDDAIEIMTDIGLSMDGDAYHFTEIVDGIEDEDTLTFGFVFNEEYDIKELPIFISDIATDDFFADEENVDFFKQASEKAEYKELYNRVSNYIDENDVLDSDSAYEIKGILEPVQENMDKVEVKYDDFDNVSTIYYQGLNDINNENYIVPFITTNDNTMNFLIGFERSDWLFADNVVFNVDGDRENFGTYNFDTDVLDGGIIREVDTKTNYSEDTLEKILESDDVKLRFEGKNENLDYTLTDTDLEAIKTIHSFEGIKNDLSNLLFRFENN